MHSKDFCFWLQGFFEITSNAKLPTLDDYQIKVIKQHLDLVFKHDPAINKKECEHEAIPVISHPVGPYVIKGYPGTGGAIEQRIMDYTASSYC